MSQPGASDLLKKDRKDWNAWETQLAVALDQDGVEKKQVFRAIALLCLNLNRQEANALRPSQFSSLYDTIETIDQIAKINQKVIGWSEFRDALRHSIHSSMHTKLLTLIISSSSNDPLLPTSSQGQMCSPYQKHSFFQTKLQIHLPTTLHYHYLHQLYHLFIFITFIFFINFLIFLINLNYYYY